MAILVMLYSYHYKVLLPITNYLLLTNCSYHDKGRVEGLIRRSPNELPARLERLLQVLHLLHLLWLYYGYTVATPTLRLHSACTVAIPLPYHAHTMAVQWLCCGPILYGHTHHGSSPCCRWSRCARMVMAAAACHCCAHSGRRRLCLLWLYLLYLPWLYVGCMAILRLYLLFTLGQAPPEGGLASNPDPNPDPDPNPNQAPPEGGLACGGGCDNCATVVREAAEARRRPALLDLSREAVLAVRLG